LLALFQTGWFVAKMADPRPVPAGDQEIAWLHIPTSGETWENFVWGIKRAEMSSAPAGLQVDDSGAFPARTTAVPEVVISRTGFSGKIRVRWYKVTNDAPTGAWVKALAARTPAPLAIIGGWSSDRARELAEAMAATEWPSAKPLLLLSTATADSVYPDEENYAVNYQPPKLISLYNRSFRFCFTNRQMANAVTDFVFSEPTLRPGPVARPWLAELWPDTVRTQAFAVTWKDDPYSLDLSQQFRDAIAEQGAIPGRPRVSVESELVPFSAGRFARPNPYEAQIVDFILTHPSFPRRDERTVIVIPTVTAPARRVLGALAQGNPTAARRLVAITGDGIPVNALFRDGEFAWPVRSVPIPLVLSTHHDPFDWDEPGDPAPPRGYELVPPAKPGEVKNSTEDIQLFNSLIRVVATSAFRDGSSELVSSADELESRFRNLSPAYFDASGNRLSGSGEHVVVLRPAARLTDAIYSDATIEVYTRQTGKGWLRIRTRQVLQTVRPQEGGAGE
jgi:hypothetical protein